MMKRILTLTMIITLMGMLLAGCGSSDSAGDSNTSASKEQAESTTATEAQTDESDQYLEAIRQAYADFYKAPLRQLNHKYIGKYSNGEFESNRKGIIDFENQKMYNKRESINRYQNAPEGQEESKNETISYQAVVDGKEYLFKKTKAFGSDKKKWYKVELPKERPEGEEWFYIDDYKNETGQEFLTDTDYEKYQNILISQDGEEEINGVRAIKYKIEYDISIPNLENITRESLLEEYGFEEDVLKKIDGMSEAIDKYVEAKNKDNEMERQFHHETHAPIYLSAENGELLRDETVHDLYNSGKDENYIQATEAFNEYIDKYDFYAYDINAMGEEESLKFVNSKDFKYPGLSSGEPVYDSDQTDYFTGNRCEKIPDLPEKPETLTWKEYEEGGYGFY